MYNKLKEKKFFTKQLVIVSSFVCILALIIQIPIKTRAANTLSASDWTTFQTALNNAQNGDTIELTASFSGSTTPLTFAADGRNITIASSVPGTPMIISQNNVNIRHINITGTGIAGITFTDVILDGKNVGGGLNTASSLTLNLYNPIIQNCSNSTNGAGINMGNGAKLNLYNGRILNNKITNTANAGGGVFGQLGSTLFIEGSIISGNSAGYGSGVYVKNNSIITISNTTVENNSATYTGGGVYSTASGTINITNSTIDNNAAGAAGGIFGNTSSNITITDSTISNNIASKGPGGGILAASNTTLTLNNDTTIIGNKANDATIGVGGGIGLGDLTKFTISANSNVKILNNTSSNNGAGIGTAKTTDKPTINIYSGLIDGNKIANTASGAGIWAGSGTINMTAGTISNNINSDVGGGIALYNAGTLNMSGGTITQNSARKGGGGVFAYTTAKINITGGTISNNVAQNVDIDANMGGGGIFGNASVVLNISNANIIGNIAEKGHGGGIKVGSLNFTITDSNITDNVAKVGDGGGIYAYSSKVTLLGTTNIKGNTALNGNGGGIFNNSFSNVIVPSSSVVFSDNIAKQAYMIKDADKTTHATNIKATQFSIDTGYGYNNYDISYTGDKEYVPFTITLDASDSKIYKPSWAPTTAKIRTIGTISVNNTVKYIMLPTTDVEIITTKDQFEQKYASLSSEYKGEMNETGAGSFLYNMYSVTDGSLNGVLDNCKIWVMATGTNILDSSEVVAFDTHTFTNIYTPIDIYHQGQTATNSTLYSKTRVGIGADLEAKYGVPVDLDGSVISSPINGYDSVDIIHKNLENLWTFNPSTQDDILGLVLDDMSYKNQTYTFKYDKNSSNWFDATFKFEDDGQNTLHPDELITDFIPYNGIDQISYMLGLDQYMPPNLINYDPVGYKIDSGSLVSMSFPLKYGEIILPSDNSVVTIIYRQNQIKVEEKYHLFERDINNVENDTGEIAGISSNTSYVTNGDTFTGAPPKFDGYVYRGYSIDGGLTFTDVSGYPDAPYDPYTDNIPSFNVIANTEVIYKYKVDTNRTGIADEDLKQVTVTSVGIDSHGKVVGEIGLKQFNIIYDETFTPNPQVTINFDGFGWILSTETDLYPIDPFVVKENTAIKFYYHKDTSGNGIPDYLEANINLKYTDELTGSAILSDMIITEFAATDSFTRVAPYIPSYIAVGVIIHKTNEPAGTPVYFNGAVKGEIALLGENIWNMIFLYQKDQNNNGIADNVEATIIVETVYTYVNGTKEKESKTFVGKNGDSIKISSMSFNKDYDKFEYVGGMSSEQEDYVFNNTTSKIVVLNYKERQVTPTPEPTPKPDDKKPIYNGGGGSNNNSYTPSQRESNNNINNQTTTETPKQNKNNKTYSSETFYKPQVIFKDGKLIPLKELVYNGPYINGYPDKTMHPEGNLTRAEAAQIIYNIYGRPDISISLNNFNYKDVNSNAWYAKAVAFLTSYNFIVGYPDGNFYPNKEITRAELVTLIAKYENITGTTENIFVDVKDHWAKPQINAASKEGIVTGYPDQTFKPNNMATRAETVAIINKILDRPDKWIGNNDYKDLNESEWAYKKLMNASKGYLEE